ncbi:hypothetical protein RF55_23716 [Lasius niger]|uniref:Uncharacterized protein n=1 Tax=Lasius niger TaxID=67767 RepID=A0A0J7JVT1_LASNI|nr:hypothetical protein RF55_23716 [Lasius niger]
MNDHPLGVTPCLHRPYKRNPEVSWGTPYMLAVRDLARPVSGVRTVTCLSQPITACPHTGASLPGSRGVPTSGQWV